MPAVRGMETVKEPVMLHSPPTPTLPHWPLRENWLKRLPVYVYVNVSARALGTPMAVNSNGMIHKDFRIFLIPPRRARREDTNTRGNLLFACTITADLALLKRNDLPTPGMQVTAEFGHSISVLAALFS